MSIEVKFNFKTEKEKDIFIAWFLDGGGENDLADLCEVQEIPFFVSSQEVKGSWDSINMEQTDE